MTWRTCHNCNGSQGESCVWELATNKTKGNWTFPEDTLHQIDRIKYACVTFQLRMISLFKLDVNLVKKI